MSSPITQLTEVQRAAHRAAHYHATTPRSMPLRVYEHSTELTQIMRKRFVQTAALLTAHNPAGKKQTPAKNKKANDALLRRIEALGLAWLPGHRKAFVETDPHEEGYLVFGITGGQLEALMEEFDQEVALWCPASGTPVLMLHPRARRHYRAADLAFEQALLEEQAAKKKNSLPRSGITQEMAGHPQPAKSRAARKAGPANSPPVAGEGAAPIPSSKQSIVRPASSRRKNSVKV